MASVTSSMLSGDTFVIVWHTFFAINWHNACDLVTAAQSLGFGAQRPKLMDKANPRIKLRITCQTFLDTRHADKDKSNPSGIEDGA